MHDEIVWFIEQFKRNAGSCYKSALEDVFTSGNCYWFAKVLMERFSSESPKLYYLQIEGHFIVRIHNRFYDILGEKTVFDEEPIQWTLFKKIEPARANQIYRNCALFKE